MLIWKKIYCPEFRTQFGRGGDGTVEIQLIIKLLKHGLTKQNTRVATMAK